MKSKQGSPPALAQEAYHPPCSKSWWVPTLAGGGYLPWLGVLTLARGYPPWWGVPTMARGVPTLAEEGVPTLARGYLPWPGGTYLTHGGTYLGWDRVPFRCEQTENITSRRTTYASVNNSEFLTIISEVKNILKVGFSYHVTLPMTITGVSMRFLGQDPPTPSITTGLEVLVHHLQDQRSLLVPKMDFRTLISNFSEKMALLSF